MSGNASNLLGNIFYAGTGLLALGLTAQLFSNLVDEGRRQEPRKMYNHKRKKRNDDIFNWGGFEY